MCGRYYFDINEKELREIGKEIQTSLYEDFKTGEIFPTNRVPIIIGDNNNITPYIAKWGLPKWDNKGVIINARVENLHERKTFKKLINSRRCIIPASSYFEWKKDENHINKKYEFRNTDSILYMAGLYNVFSENNQGKQLSLFENNNQDFLAFTIITKEANGYVSSIHNRMPLIFTKKEMQMWLNGYDIDTLVSQNNYALILP